ncbi:MAG TPA: tetratricopeptide repeat protein [Gammaproteobacteria bacterium]|nr:tetratricopeptide repeat protein [Gammaproteobacteria bacterium]
METYVTEEQQLDAIRKWFKEHGKTLLTAISLAVLLALGIRYWLHHKEVVRLKASDQYMAMVLNQNQEDVQSMQTKAQTLMKDFSHTPYASLAALQLAKHAVETQEFAKALQHLQWVIDNSSVVEFQLVARARAARILMHLGQYEKALQLCTVTNSDGYTSLLEELKGDIYVAQNKPELAKKAYTAALKSTKEKDLEHPLLRMKLQELGGTEFQNGEETTS